MQYGRVRIGVGGGGTVVPELQVGMGKSQGTLIETLLILAQHVG